MQSNLAFELHAIFLDGVVSVGTSFISLTKAIFCKQIFYYCVMITVRWQQIFSWTIQKSRKIVGA